QSRPPPGTATPSRDVPGTSNLLDDPSASPGAVEQRVSSFACDGVDLGLEAAVVAVLSGGVEEARAVAEHVPHLDRDEQPQLLHGAELHAEAPLRSGGVPHFRFFVVCRLPG